MKLDEPDDPAFCFSAMALAAPTAHAASVTFEWSGKVACVNSLNHPTSKVGDAVTGFATVDDSEAHSSIGAQSAFSITAAEFSVGGVAGPAVTAGNLGMGNDVDDSVGEILDAFGVNPFENDGTSSNLSWALAEDDATAFAAQDPGVLQSLATSNDPDACDRQLNGQFFTFVSGDGAFGTCDRIAIICGFDLPSHR